jgi:hypothetical protein
VERPARTVLRNISTPEKSSTAAWSAPGQRLITT